MTIDKAIEQLERGTEENRSTANKRLREALGLGIGALKMLLVFREQFPRLLNVKLPGETEE